MKHLIALWIKILFALELANCLKIDPRLERIDRFLEQAYKMRNLRGLESPLHENFNPINDADNAKMNEIDSSKYDKEWTQNLESNYGAESKYEELELEIDSGEKFNKATEKFRKQAAKFKSKSKLKTAATKDDDDEEENDDDDGEKQPEMVPIPHPIPVVVPKLIPMPIIIQHTFPFPMYPMSLPNVQMDSLMNTHTSDQHTDDAHESRRFMPNAHRRPSIYETRPPSSCHQLVSAENMAVGKVDAVSLTLKWEIENFCIRCKNVGDFLESPKFPANGGSSDIQWYLRLYPKGKEEKHKDYLSLFLHASAENKAVGTFIIFDNRGNKIVNFTMAEHVFDNKEKNYWGRGKLILSDFITNPVYGILNDDKLIIACEIRSITRINQEEKAQEDDNILELRLEDEYEALLNDSKFSDLSLTSEGKTMKVHKCILAKRSSVFAAMFDAEMKEKHANTVEIADIKYDVLVEMIRFIYAGKVRNIDTLAGELAVAADKYALDGLKSTCEKTMRKNLSLTNVIYCLQLADRLRMDKLKKKAIELMVENATVVSVRPDFDLLSRDIVREVFQSLANKKK